MNVALSIHGIRQPQGGRKSIDLVVKALDVDIVDVDDLDYNYVFFFRVMFNGRFVERVAGGIKKWIDNKDINKIFIFCHSNGLNFTLKALKKLKNRKQLGHKPIIIVSLSGCARRSINTDNASVVHNWFTRKDGALKAAKYHPVWSMGSFGLSHYRGKSKNVIDKDISKHIDSHSQWFEPGTLPKTIEKANELMRSYETRV